MKIKHSIKAGYFSVFFAVASLFLTGTACMPGLTGNQSGTSTGKSPYLPFPQHCTYKGTFIRPDHKTTMQIDNDVRDYYDQWKATYLKPSSVRGYYVAFETPCTDKKTVSEAHGYGMMITALMAGHDIEARSLFDGLVNFYDDHRSSINENLMDWAVDCAETPGGDDDCATDGDMDIAYAFIMAHAQWGDDGSINYLGQAKRIITQGIKTSLIGSGSYNLLLGDWDTDPWSTRSSDWMADHCRAYGKITDDVDFWGQVVDRIYTDISHVQAQHSPSSGLMPDFLVGTNMDPAAADFLEGPHDGEYCYNACRWPWRTAMDNAHYGDTRARDAIVKVVDWLTGATGSNVTAIMAGYHLDGTAYANWQDMAFTAPFAVAVACDGSHQSFLNDLWDSMIANHENYYADTINLMCQILISGNWPNPAP